MSTNIDSLDIQIKTSAGSSAQNIDELASALGRLRSNAKLTAVSNNLTKLAKALDGLNASASALTNIQKLETAFNGLSNIPKLTGLSSAVNSLKKIPDIVKGLNVATLDRFEKQMRKLADALSPLAEKITLVADGFARLPNRISSAVTATNRMAKANKDVSDSLNTSSVNLMATIQNYETLLNVMNQVIDVVSGFMAQAIEWDGIQFRFGRAFGEDAEDVYEYVLKINEVMGINIQEFMQYSSLYGSLLSGFGMAQEKVTTISVGLTELSYDIWAAYNDRFKSLEDASEAVRSAITGEIEPIRNAGIALTEASLQEYMDSVGMAHVSIEKLTEAQKSEVRYAAMVNAALNQGIIGTYAREMNTAEGAVRSLSQSFKTLTQALGSLFIPLLQLVVPYVTAFVELLTEAVFWVAKLFNIPIFEISWGDSTKGVDSLADGADKAASGLGAASDAAKKLKNYTMGFDELNVIDPNSGSGSGKKGGADDSGWGSGLDLKDVWDDSIFAQASKRVDELKEKIKGFFGEWGVEIALIGAAFLAWKFSKKFLAALDIVKITLQALSGNAGAQGALSLFGLDKLSDTVIKLRGLLLKTPIGALIMGSGTASLTVTVGAVVAVSAAILALVGGLVLVYKNSENFREGLRALGEGVLWIFTKIGEVIGWVTEKIGEFGAFVGEKLSDIMPDGLLDFFKGLDLGIGDLLITAGGLALFGPWGLAIEGAVLAIKAIGFAAKDSLTPVDLFGEGISDITKEKVEPFIENMEELENTLAQLDWGNAIVSKKDVADVSSKLKVITETIVNELDGDKNKALANLDPLKGAMSDEKFADLLSKVESSYSEQTKIVEAGEARINEILARASQEARALTDEESKEISRIQREMKNTGIRYLSESETESNLILQRLKDNASKLSAEQASDVIKNALSARDETIAAATEQYDGILLEAQRLLDTGAINKAEYDEIIKTAETAKNDTISAANKQYDEILKTAKSKMGEYSKYIDGETGEVKSNWEVFCEDFSTKWNDTWDDIFAWFDKNVKPKFTKEYWIEKFQGLKDGLIQTIKNAVNGGIELMNSFIGWMNTNLNFSWNELKIAGKQIYPSGSVQLFTIPLIPKFENGGFIEDGLFTMNRGEIAGRFNNGKSVVANNQQIIAGISEGVYRAVVSAMGDTQNNGERPVVVYLDGKQIYSSVKKRDSQRGVNLMGNQLGYTY